MQDFTQEAYLRAWQRWKRLRDYDNPESWLRLVVSRLATDRWRWLGLRRRSARQPADYDAVVDPSRGPSVEMVLLISELKRLPMPQRRALVLHYLLDRPVADIAQETGASVNTVKSWLMRGRASLAAQLAETLSVGTAGAAGAMETLGTAGTVSAETIAARGRRAQRRRTTARSIIAFLTTTATAAAAYLLFGQVPAPEPIGPDLFVPYGYQSSLANASIVGHRAFIAWQGQDGRSTAGVIDLKQNKLIGSPIDAGQWNHLFLAGTLSDGGAHFFGYNNPGTAPAWALFTVDPDTGQLLWRYDSEAGDAASPRIFREAVVLPRPGSSGRVTALDAITGRPKWTLDLPLEQTSISADGNRLALLSSDGTLSIRDPATGGVVSEISGVPMPPPPRKPNDAQDDPFSYAVIQDYLYVSDGASMSRRPLNGDRPAEKLVEKPTEYGRMEVFDCGEYLCLRGALTHSVVDEPGQALLLDKASGREVRRLWVHLGGEPLTSGRGMIFSSVADSSMVVYDRRGRDISPPNMTDRTAQWVGDDRLLLIGQKVMAAEGGLGQRPEGTFYVGSELSIYSFKTGKETRLDEVVLRGACTTAPGMIVCPTELGFQTYH